MNCATCGRPIYWALRCGNRPTCLNYDECWRNGRWLHEHIPGDEPDHRAVAPAADGRLFS